MENVISKDDRIAIAEVDYIIHHMNERYLNKIPQKIRDYITILKKKNVDIYVDPHKPLDKQGLKEFTLYFLMILNLKYWCDEQRRKDILFMMENNQKKFEDKVNNIFGQAETMQSVSGTETASSKPRQIVTVGADAPTADVKKDETLQEVKAKAEDIVEAKKENEVIKQEEQSNMIDELKETEQSIIATDEASIFTKIINKLKELKNKFIRSK